MRWTWLRACYSFPMRVYIGGRAYAVPARWYFCDPNAQLYPSPHGCEASPWLLNFERNDAWGEITPWPQDQRPGTTWRGLNRGTNPGYVGLCYVGDRQWFTDGMLPADVLSRPPLPFPDCCRPNLPLVLGGLVLGGGSIVSGPAGHVSRGGLALGGSAAAHGPTGYVSRGGLALGGSAVAGYAYRSAGGLALGGHGRTVPDHQSGGGLALGGTAAASGGGGTVTGCCPGLSLPDALHLLISNVSGCACFAGSYTMTKAPGATWQLQGVAPCGVPSIGITADFECISSGSPPTYHWQIGGDNGLFFLATMPSTVDCTPGSFRVTFDDVNVTGRCTGVVDLVVTE
jgi:hypothetical protein